MSNVYRSNKKSGGITPTGTKQITINAAGTTTHDVAAYANAEVTTSGLVKPTGTKTITENGTGIDVANYEFVDVNVSGGGSPIETVLWENSAPSSSFSEQSIQLNESLLNYDYIRVECNYSTSNTTINGSTLIPVSEFIGTFYGSQTSRFFFGLVGRGQNILTRVITNGASSPEGNNVVFFSNCFLYSSQTGQQNNSYVIPTKIIGLKLQGGEDMPIIDFANPVTTLAKNGTYTANAGDYLYVGFISTDAASGVVTVSIDGTVVSEASYANASRFVGNTGLFKLNAGSVVSVDSNASSGSKIYIVREVTP